MTAVRLPNSQNREWDGAYCSSVLAQHAPSLQKKNMAEAQIEHRLIRLGDLFDLQPRVKLQPYNETRAVRNLPDLPRLVRLAPPACLASWFPGGS